MPDFVSRMEMVLAQEKALGWIWRISGDRLDLVPPMESLTDGFPPPETLPFDRWFERIHPEDLSIVEGILNKIRSGKCLCHEIEYRFLGTDRTWLWLNSRGKVIESDEAGHPLRAAGLVIDVTDKHLAKDALLKTMNKFRNCFQGGINLRCLHRADDEVIVDVNEMLIQRTGFSKEELLGLRLSESPFIADHRKVALLTEKVRSGQRIQPTETALLTRSGEIFPCLFASETCPFGEVLHALCEFSDISSVKQAEELRRRLEQSRPQRDSRVQLALEATGDAIWDWDLTKGRLYWSDDLLRWLKWEPDDLPEEGRGLLKITHPDDAPLLKEALRRHFNQKTSLFQMRFRLLTASGGWKWVLARGRAIVRSPSGRPMRFAGTFQDIDEMMQERELREQVKADLIERSELDLLTGLRLRGAFLRDLGREVERAHRYRTPLSLVMAEIDGLTSRGEAEGPEAEKALVLRTATLLKGHLRQSDLLARWGEADFVILTSQKGTKSLRLAEKLVSLARQELNMTLSCGVTSLGREDSPEKFLQRARVALCQVKAGGGNGAARS